MTHPPRLCPELPAPPQRIVAFAVTALVLGIGLAVWLETPKGPECIGILTARTTHVMAPTDGIVAEWTVQEGELVTLGDALLRFDDATLTSRILDKKREIAALESALQQSLASAQLELDWRLRTLESELCDIQLRSASFLKEKYNFELQRSMLSDVLAGREFVMAEGATSLFDEMISGEKTGANHRMATVLEMELAANAAEVSAAQVEICAIREKQLLDLKESLPKHIRRTQGVDVAEANLNRAQAELDQLLTEQTELTINSPAIGKVGVFQCRAGDQLKAGEPIVELLDDSKRHLVVYVPSQQIPLFELQTVVDLKFPGGDTYAGTVTSIAPQAKPHTLPGDPANDTMILVHVEQSGRVWPNLPLGSQVRVRPSVE